MFAIIMAGGSGTRFWPASRERLPKQFLKITSDRALFEETLDRLKPLVEDDRIYVVVNRLHEEITGRLLGDRPSHVLIEPVGRNTAPCIGLAALHIGRIARDEPIVVLPSDHFIADAEGFARKLRAAAELAQSGAIVTLGIPPTRPETGFGYIECGEEGEALSGEKSFRIKKFVEKPDHETALRYLASGRHLWNSGIFIFTAETILSEIESCLPGLHAGLCRIGEAIGGERYLETVESVYPELESVSIDYGIMEKTRAPIISLRGDFGWSDVGSWQALYELRANQYDEGGNLLMAEAMIEDARGNLVYSTTERRVALLGVEGLIVVDTPDALMVADRGRSQEVKKFPERLKKDAPV